MNRLPSCCRHWSLAASLALCLAACAPSLNWRSVQLGHLSTLLPCKPDTATRQVALADTRYAMEMAGCQVGDALFAISRIQVADAAQAPAAMAALRSASLAQVQASAVHPLANSGNAQTSFDVLVDGKRPDGTPVQARFQWKLFATEVYQIAAYATHLGPEQTEPLLGEARIR
ncbi:MAG: hypothetical protein HXX19_07940 [Rhodoferax sp.]|nr:hypothetical protein [Rhodoferax sp.]